MIFIILTFCPSSSSVSNAPVLPRIQKFGTIEFAAIQDLHFLVCLLSPYKFWGKVLQPIMCNLDFHSAIPLYLLFSFTALARERKRCGNHFRASREAGMARPHVDLAIH